MSKRRRNSRKGNERALTHESVFGPNKNSIEANGGYVTDENIYGDESRTRVEKALGCTPFWRGVSIIAGHVAKLPLNVYKFTGATSEIDKSHPANYLIRHNPNEYMTAFAWKLATMVQVITRGNSYSWIERDKVGNPVAIYLINDPDLITPYRDDSGQLWYMYNAHAENTGDIDALAYSDVIHLRGLSFNGVVGLDPMVIHRDTVFTAISAKKNAKDYYSSGATPSGVLTTQKVLGDDARKNMRESWERVHKGLQNKHKIAILDNGTTFQPISQSAEDSQLLESRKFDATEYANITGVPPHKVGDPSKVAYNSIAQENRSYLTDTLGTWLTAHAVECREKLLSMDEKRRETHDIWYSTSEIQEADVPTQVANVATLTEKGLLTINEGRQVLDYNPVPGGDVLKSATPTPANNTNQGATNVEE